MVPVGISSRSGDFVYALCEDKTRNIWIGTIGAGLTRYDPVYERFTKFKHDPSDQSSLRSDSVFSIFQDHAGHMWIGTLRGLDLFDSTKQAFVHVFPDALSPPDSVSNQVVSICERRSQPEVLWLGMLGGGLVRFEWTRGTTKRYLHVSRDANSLSNNTVRLVYEAHGFPAFLWICTEGGGINRFEVSQEQFASFKSDTAPPPRQGHDFVRAMMQDRSGIMWLGTRGGLSRFNPTTGRSVHYESDPRNPKAIVKGHINAIFEDASGTHWVGTRGGLDRFPPVTERLVLYQHDPSNPQSLSDNALYALHEDRTGILWIATWGGGLNRYDPASEIFTVYKHNPRDPSSLRNDYLKTVFKDRAGTLWAGNAEGILHRFDQRTGKWKAFSILSDAKNDFDKTILSIFEDKDGLFWIGTDEDLYTLDRSAGTFHQVALGPPGRDGLKSRSVTALFEDRKGILWIGTRRDGLIRYEKPTGAVAILEHDPKNPRSLSHNQILYIHEDRRGALWVATGGGGLNRLEAETTEFTSFTSADGLPDNTIYGFLEDDVGNFWIGTDGGLCRFNPDTRKCKILDVKDGLQGKEFNFRSFCRSRNGRMFFGGNNGLNAFYPDSIRANLHVPPVVITNIKIFDKVVKTKTGFPYLSTLTLPYYDNYLSFEFTALDFKNQAKNQYAYMLQGLDNDWIQCGDRRYATYTNLEGGSYTFRVKGSNNDGVWNEEGTSILVTIMPPFWATWWFRSFAIIALFASVGGGVRYLEMRKMKRRIELLEQERALERERSRISQDMHDEVGASLTEIAILSELARKEMGDKSDLASSHIRKIADRSREVVDSISEIIWTINPKNDHLHDLVAYLHHYAMLFLKSTAIRCRFESPETVPDFSLSAETRRHIFLVVKEALHNVVKHSEATETTVRCGFGDGMMEVSVEDNGKGFLLHQNSRFGNGVLNMRKRIENIGGTFSLDSHLGHGTKVCISVPIAVSKG
jgi:ligand-binding sensor domain-containing protein/signal transduction histidine kinase